MSHREEMSSVDTTWLRMDRPQNLMLIVAVWMLEGPVALDRLENQLAQRQLTYAAIARRSSSHRADLTGATTRISTSPITSSG